MTTTQTPTWHAQTIYEAILKDHDEVLFHLRDRWQDEKQYEDFEQYRKVITDRINGEILEVVKVTSSPFKVTVRHKPSGLKIVLKINAKSITGSFSEK